MSLGRQHPAWCARRHRGDNCASDPVTVWNASSTRITIGVEQLPGEPEAAVAVVVLCPAGVTTLRLTIDQSLGLHAGLVSLFNHLETYR